MCRCEKGRLLPEDLEEVQRVEDEDAKARPAGADAGQGEEGIDAEDAEWNQRVACALLDQDEDDKDEDADDHDEVGIWCCPADHGALVPGKVEQDEGGYTGDGAHGIEALPDTGAFRLWGSRGWGCGNREEAQDSQQEARKAQDPIRPRPPESLRKQAGEDGTEQKAARSSGPEQAEDHVLTKARVVAATDDSDGVGEQESRADSLQGTANDEEAGAAIHSNTGETRPQGKPDIAGYEELLVPKDIAEAACDEDEGADGERVSRGEPAQLARLIVDVKGASDYVLRDNTERKTGLSEKLRGADDGDKEDLAGEGLGTFDFGIILTILTV